MLDNEFDSLSKSIGFPSDQLKYLTCMMLCYPAGLLYRNISSANGKHLFSIVLSLTFITFCLGPTAWFHSFITSLVAYLIVSYVPNGTAHKLVFVWVLGYMSVSHLYRQYVDYMGWTLDFTTMQMILTIKLISFAYNYYDGNKPQQEASEEQKKRAIKKLPSILEFYGFVYFYGTFLAGPSIEIKEYQQYVDGSMFNDQACKGKIPSTILPTLKSFAVALAFGPLLVLASMYPIAIFTTDEYFLQTPLWLKLAMLLTIPGLHRAKYYFGWSLAEGACNLIGFGYSGADKDGKLTWERCKNVYVREVEVAPNIRSITTYWNWKTGDWLKNYVYLRLSPEGTRPPFSTTVITYAVSAFWHGFYPGYYLFFLTAALYTEVARDLRRVVRPLFLTADEKPNYPLKYVHDIGSILVTMLFLNYAGVCFLLLSLENALKFYNGWMWSGHLITIIAYIVLRYGFPPKRSSRGKETTKKAQ